MKTLNNLKERLLALPSVLEGRKHEALYAAFLERSLVAQRKLAEASLAVLHGDQVLPSADYGEPRKTVKTCAGSASRLKEKLSADAAAVAEAGVDKSFTRLSENADAALKTCQVAWQESLQAKIKDWEAISEVVSKLGDGEGAKSLKVQARRLKEAIGSLQSAKAKLPQSKQDADKVLTHLKDLGDSVSNLGLNTPFGKFLQEAASASGADLAAVQKDEVSEMIKKHSLQKVFRIKLSS